MSEQAIERRLMVLATACLALLATGLGWTGPVAALMTFPFLLAGPGLALLGILRIRDGLLEAALVVPVSLSVQGLVATLFVYIGLYSAPLVLVVTIGICMLALLAARTIAGRSERAPHRAGLTDAKRTNG